MKKIKKAIILAAGLGSRFLPFTKSVPKELLPILNKPVIHYLVEEVISSGIEEVVIVISRDKESIQKYFVQNKMVDNNDFKLFGNSNIKVSFVYQNQIKGLVDAILQAKSQIQNAPFAIILGDDLISSKVPALKQLINIYEKTMLPTIASQKISKKYLSKYGVLNLDTNTKLINAIEKPQINSTNSRNVIIGRYIFNLDVWELFEKHPSMNLVDIINLLNKQSPIQIKEINGIWYDCGSIEGFVKANIDFSLKDKTTKGIIQKFIKNKLI